MTERHRAPRGGMGMRVKALTDATQTHEAFPLPAEPADWDLPMNGEPTVVIRTADPVALPAPDHGITSTCTRCDGRGHIRRTAPELLAEALALAAGEEPGPRMVARLLETLLADGGREDAEALAADLPRLYDPDSPDALARLDGLLTSVGARHVASQGPYRGLGSLTLDEFAQVKTMLLESLRRAVGAMWRPEYELAWSRAYDYAAVRIMVAAQQSALAGLVAPQLTAEVQA